MCQFPLAVPDIPQLQPTTWHRGSINQERLYNKHRIPGRKIQTYLHTKPSLSSPVTSALHQLLLWTVCQLILKRICPWSFNQYLKLCLGCYWSHLCLQHVFPMENPAERKSTEYLFIICKKKKMHFSPFWFYSLLYNSNNLFCFHIFAINGFWDRWNVWASLWLLIILSSILLLHILQITEIIP